MNEMNQRSRARIIELQEELDGYRKGRANTDQQLKQLESEKEEALKKSEDFDIQKTEIMSTMKANGVDIDDPSFDLVKKIQQMFEDEKTMREKLQAEKEGKIKYKKMCREMKEELSAVKQQ